MAKHQMVNRTVLKVASTFNGPFTTESVIGRMKEMRYKHIPVSNRIGQILSAEFPSEYVDGKVRVFNPKP